MLCIHRDKKIIINRDKVTKESSQNR